MSKSKSLSPGLNDSLNVIGTHVTWSCVMPSCSAIAYATALSKPSPLAGLPVPLFGCAFHGPYVPVPPNHGWNAGLSVPTVSVPGREEVQALGGARVGRRSPVAPVAGDVAPVGPLAPAPSSFDARHTDHGQRHQADQELPHRRTPSFTCRDGGPQTSRPERGA